MTSKEIRKLPQCGHQYHESDPFQWLLPKGGHTASLILQVEGHSTELIEWGGGARPGVKDVFHLCMQMGLHADMITYMLAM
jgi:hypothetical protein